MNDTLILECKNLRKEFNATVAVKNVSFSMNRGDILGIVGENGAGKSTLIKILGGEYRPDGGTISYVGSEVHWNHSSDALNVGISIVHQHPLLVEDFTAEENIFLGKEYVNRFNLVNNAKISDESRDLLKQYGIYYNLDLKKRISLMSAGEKQVVEILRIFFYNPKLLILDEPTASLPKEEAERLLILLKKLNSEKKLTIVYISHKLEETFSICNKIMVMRNGENVGIMPQAEFDRARLIQMMMNANLAEFYPPKDSRLGQVMLEMENVDSDKIKKICLNIRTGEIVGLYGLMGSGMSDVAKILFGLKKKKRGLIRLNYKNETIVDNKNVKDMINRGIYLIPEDRLRNGLIAALNIRENTTLAHLAFSLPERLINIKKEKKIAENELKKMNTKYADLDQKIVELSGGNQQKVIVSRWLMRECNILIVDDPTVGIDIGTKKDIYNLLRNLAGRGKGILLISSEINEIIGVADRVYTMRNGSISSELTGDELNQKNILENIL
jgi:ABC-type sugar transport system ATPase subunit